MSTLALAGGGCSSKTTSQLPEPPPPPRQLSAFGMFVGNGASQEPAEGVIPYDLNTPLFSDYALKYRFVKLPAGTSAQYHDQDAFEFPVGTVIAKTFAYPADARDPAKGQRLIETRILKHEAEGWVGLPYIWNDEQTEATLAVAGATRNITWIDEAGQERKVDNYIIPNANQCKGCHKTDGQRILPIGPKARHLNRDFVYHAAGGDLTENQLAHWQRAGALRGAPEPQAAPRVAVWNDPSTGSLDERARAWLDVNCAHCHNPQGPARNSGLDLQITQQDPFRWGVGKPPVAAGRGSAGGRYDIVPGKPDESILALRIASLEADVMMPELGKRLVHHEGVELVREWIASLPPTEKSP
ncbi:MAG: SO2930 family diheme c-type cytochrome [Pirellulales bacterium]